MLNTTVEQELKKWEGSYPKGWRTIVEKCLQKVSKHQSLIQVDQIKDKFGSLRFYYSVLDPPVADEILETPLQTSIYSFEDMCGHICEECGTTLDVSTGPLDPATRGWYFTLCDKCRTYKNLIKDITK